MRDIELTHERYFHPTGGEIYQYFDLFVGNDKIKRMTREELDKLQLAIERIKVGIDGLAQSFQE